jgi:IS30 family transposase
VSNEVTTLEPKLQRFVHLYLTGQYNQTQIAQILEVHKNTINQWLKREDVGLAIKEYQQLEHEMYDVQIKAMRMKAIQKMNDLMDSPIDGIAFQACKDILDRTGHKAKNEIKVDKTVKTIEVQLNELADSLINDVDFEVLD